MRLPVVTPPRTTGTSSLASQLSAPFRRDVLAAIFPALTPNRGEVSMRIANYHSIALLRAGYIAPGQLKTALAPHHPLSPEVGFLKPAGTGIASHEPHVTHRPR